MGVREQIEAVIRATTFRARMSYSWFGTPSPLLQAALRQTLTPEVKRKCLLYDLQSRLYKDFYCRGFPVPAEPEALGRNLSMAPFVRQLSVANSGIGYRSIGWDVLSERGLNVVVRREGLELWVSRNDCLLPVDTNIEPGLRLGLHFPKEFLSISPGFYVAMGDRELTPDSLQVLVRFYWNLTPGGAIRFLRQATLLLNTADVPFKIKVVNDPVRFARRDAVVLYIHKLDYQKVSELIARIYPQLVGHLKTGEPAFTKQLALGVGLAEDPGTGESFGAHRCRILAEGLLRAYEQCKRSIKGRLEVIEKCFEESNIDLYRPFISLAEHDDYDFRPHGKEATGTETLFYSELKPGPNSFLEAAGEIGRRLMEQAVWHEDRCNWMGAEGGPILAKDAAARRYSALGPDLYSGTSGVAVFLSELYAANGLADVRRCALGAMHQALSCIETLEREGRFGLHTGVIGVAFAAACVAQILCESSLKLIAARMLKKVVFAEGLQGEFDFIYGTSGAIAALITLQDLLVDEWFLLTAMKMGDCLLRSAEKSPIGYSWRSPPVRGHKKQRNLTGFAHGTAGAGFALMELFRVTRKMKYAEGAEQAFRYEAQWFDSKECNWPDFRNEEGSSKKNHFAQRFSTGWCHGAPGIALSRLRAYEISKDPQRKREAITALQITSRTTRTWLEGNTDNYSLCHGMTGNAEILRYGWQVLGEEFVEGLTIARAVANARIASSKTHDKSEFSEIKEDEAPGLMLGLSGIGHFYLRSYDHSIRSVLSLAKDL
jgi:hypothetical protein